MSASGLSGGSGLNSTLVGSVMSGSAIIVTYNKWPLYYYSGDSGTDSVKGEGIGSVWYIISPNGTRIEAA